MANIIFSEGSGVNDSIFGKSQAPIKMFIEKKGEAYEQESVLPYLFKMDKSTHYAEKYSAMTAMNGFKPVGENGEYPTDGMRETFSKTLEHVTWKDKFSISREIIDDNVILELKKRPQSFLSGYYRTRERFGAALFGGAISEKSSIVFSGHTFDTTSADEKTLFATDHPSKLTKTKQSNKFSDAFSNDALAAIETAMQNFKGDNDEILNVAPDTILIPNDYTLKKAVFEAIGADKDPNTANNGFNYNFGRWNVIVWPYLNEFIGKDAKPWIVGASGYNEENASAAWLDRVALEIKSEIASNDANEWKGYARFTAGFNDWRGFAIGGIASGTALIS